MTSPHQHEAYPEDSDGRGEPVEGRGTSDADPHADSRGSYADDPIEGPLSTPDG